jgi:hypothetical protein
VTCVDFVSHDGVMYRWVEFAHKSDAKRIATMLNGEPMGKFPSAVFSFLLLI